MMFLKRTYISLFTFLFVVCAVSYAYAQAPTVRLPRPSQKASVMQTIGVTDLTITYSRPGVKGRQIWGDPVPAQASAKGEATLDDQNARPKGAPIVPYGHVWRTGANEATQFEVTDDVLINGQKLAAGTKDFVGPQPVIAKKIIHKHSRIVLRVTTNQTLRNSEK